MSKKPGVGEANRLRYKPPEVRFWLLVNKNGPIHPKYGKCWEWTGKTDRKGYGVLDVCVSLKIVVGRRKRKKVGAHRYSFSLVKTIPIGMFVLHKCDNPACVNPNHLFLGTQKDNMRDMHSKGRGNNKAKGRKGPLSDETKRKMSAAKFGTKIRKCLSCGRRTYSVICKYCEVISL